MEDNLVKIEYIIIYAEVYKYVEQLTNNSLILYYRHIVTGPIIPNHTQIGEKLLLPAIRSYS